MRHNLYHIKRRAGINVATGQTCTRQLHHHMRASVGHWPDLYMHYIFNQDCHFRFAAATAATATTSSTPHVHAHRCSSDSCESEREIKGGLHHLSSASPTTIIKCGVPLHQHQELPHYTFFVATPGTPIVVTPVESGFCRTHMSEPQCYSQLLGLSRDPGRKLTAAGGFTCVNPSV
jgi:hypothetical protein